MKLSNETTTLLEIIADELTRNEGKLSPKFVSDYSEQCTYEYGKIGNSCRVCVLTTTNGNKMVGHALVLDPNNDVAEIGNNVAKKECSQQLWGFLGGLAKQLA